jgi:transposase-like protein
MSSVDVLAGAERRRRWNAERKQAVVAAAFRPLDPCRQDSD